MRGIGAVTCSAVLVLALAVAGCGSSDDGSITKAEFVTQANAICAEGNKTIDAAGNKVFADGQPSDAEIESFVTGTMVPSVETQIADIRDLEVPDGEEDQVNAILDAADQGLEEVKADPVAVATSNTDPFAEANKLAADYGLTECAG